MKTGLQKNGIRFSVLGTHKKSKHRIPNTKNQFVDRMKTGLSIGRGVDQIKEKMEIPKQSQSPLKKSSLTSSEVEFRKLVHERAKNAPPIEEAWKILNKVDLSLTQMLIEERGKRREK